MAGAADAAAALVDSLVDEPEAQAEESASGTEEAVAEETPHETAEIELPNLDPEIPAEMRDWLDEPDFEEEAAQELAAQQEDEYLDDNPELAEERKLRLAAERKAQWLEERRLESERPRWADEAKKYAPLSEPFLSEIKATSHRAFIREAKRIHNTLRPYVEEKFLKPMQAHVAAKGAEAVAEAQEQVKTAWGTPTTNQSPSRAQETQQRVERARATKDLASIIRERL